MAQIFYANIINCFSVIQTENILSSLYFLPICLEIIIWVEYPHGFLLFKIYAYTLIYVDVTFQYKMPLFNYINDWKEQWP